MADDTVYDDLVVELAEVLMRYSRLPADQAIHPPALARACGDAMATAFEAWMDDCLKLAGVADNDA